jgi:branched-chain amino acid aminotransferase
LKERNTEWNYQFQVFRNNDGITLAKSSVSYFYEVTEMDDVLAFTKTSGTGLIKEINVNNNLLSNIRVHCPENIYGEIYARKMILMMLFF